MTTRIGSFPWWLVLLVAAIALLSGCQRTSTDLQQYIEQVKSRPGGDIEPMPTVEPHDPFLYPGHQRSPFDSTVIARPIPAEPAGIPGEVDVDFDRPREPLESFPLDSLRMVGSMEQEGIRYALIRTPDRTIQTVMPGNYIGQNFGRITDITQRDIRLVEVVPDAFGGYMERENSVALSE